MYKNRLEEIKEIHEQANAAYERFQESNAYADQDVITDSLSELFYEEHTDWLIQQTKKVERYESVLKEIADDYSFDDIYDEVNTKRLIAKQALEHK